MIKSKCLFIDHKYHSTTNSTRFLINLLTDQYDIEVLFLEDFSKESFDKIVDTAAALYVVFQYDFLAPFLLSNGRKVLIVPMYDGTGEMPPMHWLSMRDGLFLNFSEVLHKTHVSLGLQSFYTRYYPNPAGYPKFSKSLSDGNSIFFWERQPISGFSIDWLAYQLNRQNHSPKLIHIHQSPDPGQYTKRHPSLLDDIFPGKKITTSTWFESKIEFMQTLSKFGIYIAPRRAEGIGFSFIDAMACGMVVIAHDKPTMNEYIINGKNGVLFENDLPEFRQLDLEQMRSESINNFETGFNHWNNSILNILERINKYVCAPAESYLKPISALAASHLSNSFFRRQDIYLALIYNLIENVEINEVWRSRFSKPKLSARLPIQFNKNPVLSQVLLEVYSKRKKII